MWEHVHPKLAHFPIALVVTALVFDVLGRIVRNDSLYQAARYVFNLAAFCSILAVFSGIVEADHLKLNHPLLSKHRAFAIALAVSCVMSCGIMYVLPDRFKRPLFTILICLCAVLVVLTGHFGGQMVYEYGVGVEQ